MVNPLVAALGPVGGLAACACCLIIIAIWGLFATMIALAVYAGQWKKAVRRARGLSGAGELLLNHGLLIAILCIYGYVGLRRALRAVSN